MMTLKGTRVFIVDDDPDTTELYEFALGAYGATIRTALSVAEAAAALEEMVPDILISDISLPDGSGHDVVRIFRERNARLVAVALSGWSHDEDRASALESGFDEHVAKPCNPVDLAAAIERLLRDERSAPSEAARREATGARVLVVDDVVETRKLYQTVLAREGHTVITAASTAEMLDAVRDFAPQIALVDLYLPTREDGLEAIRHLREASPTCRVAVITGYLSRSADAGELAGELGVQSVHRKTDAWEHLFDAIRSAASTASS